MKTINFKLEGLTCAACVKLATSRLKKISGVREVAIAMDTGQAQVSSLAAINLDIIKQSLADTNYTVAA